MKKLLEVGDIIMSKNYSELGKFVIVRVTATQAYSSYHKFKREYTIGSHGITVINAIGYANSFSKPLFFIPTEKDLEEYERQQAISFIKSSSIIKKIETLPLSDLKAIVDLIKNSIVMMILLLLFSLGSMAQSKNDSRIVFRPAMDTIFPMLTLSLNDNPEFKIYSGKQLIAYRKHDSAWVLINPDKTRIILDSIYLQHCKR